MLAHRNGTDPLTELDAAYQRWLATQNERPLDGLTNTGWLLNTTFLHARRGPGATCLNALGQPERGTIAAPINTSKGCGAVMRSAPIGLTAGADAFDLAAQAGALTHGHPSGYLSAAALAHIIDDLYAHTSLNVAAWHAQDMLEEWDDGLEVHRAISAALELVDELSDDNEPTPEHVERLGSGFTGEEALAIALFCALAYPRDPIAAILLAINHSGDSDSTGAICGNLVGAWHGIDALPEEWLARIEGRPHIDHTAWALCETLGIEPFDDEWVESEPEPVITISAPSRVPGDPCVVHIYRHGPHLRLHDPVAGGEQLDAGTTLDEAIDRAWEGYMMFDLRNPDEDMLTTAYELTFEHIEGDEDDEDDDDDFDEDDEDDDAAAREPDQTWLHANQHGDELEVSGVHEDTTTLIAIEHDGDGYDHGWKWNVSGYTTITISPGWDATVTIDVPGDE